MAEILAVERDGGFRVTCTDGASVTEHDVDVPAEALTALGVSDHEPRAVVEESFRFLLEREPKEAILARFALPDIGRYFPDYPEAIRRRMAGQAD